MIYLLDANTIIDAKRDYYPIDSVPEFWDWLVYHGQQGSVKIPMEIYNEFLEARQKGLRDDLSEWADQMFVREALILDEEPDMDHVARVTYGGYMPTPTDEDLAIMGQDPFLISYALRDVRNRTIVTSERSKPSAQGAKKRIPDVCKTLGILPAIHGFEFFRALKFSTSFRSELGISSH